MKQFVPRKYWERKNVKHLVSIDLLVNHEGVLQMENHIFLLPALFSEMSTNHSHSWYHSIRGINYKILHMATFLAYLLWWFGWMCNRIFCCYTLRLNANLTEFQTQNANLIWWICVQVTQCTTLPVRRTPNQIW